jgi:hypothetical protein
VRSVLVGAVATIAAWVALLVTAGHVGLSRSVAIGPATLLERPAAVGATLGVAVVVAHLAGRAVASRPSWLAAVAGSVSTTIVGSAVLAPLAVGELEIGHAPIVFVVLSLVGAVFVAIGAAVALVRDPTAPLSRDE